MNEIASQDTSLTAVERSMGTREIAEGPARTAVLKRRYDAPVKDVRLTPDGQDATWLDLEHASIADVFRNDPETGCYGVGTGWEGPLHYLGEYLRGVLPDRPSMEWYSFDEADELRLAEHRGREWARVEAQHAG